jgi:hypothetical protein
LPDDAPRCPSTNRDGSPCRGLVRPGKTHCFAHDPALAERRAAGNHAGGSTPRRHGRALLPAAELPPAEAIPDVKLTTTAEVIVFLGVTINEVRRGQLDPKVGNCLSALIGQLIKSIAPGDTADELAEMKKQIEELRNAHVRNGASRTQRTAPAARRAEGQRREPDPDRTERGPGLDPLFGPDAS